MYILAAALALFSGGMFSCLAIAVLSLALSGIAETMHGVESDVFSFLVVLVIIAVVCLAASIISLIKYIKICIVEKNPQKTIKSILLFAILLPFFMWLIFYIIL